MGFNMEKYVSFETPCIAQRGQPLLFRCEKPEPLINDKQPVGGTALLYNVGCIEALQEL